ncbi:SAM-dependent methyltransferase [uncultured Hydrogenophaga sp.]|uniref:SAM-dependent methyltransferase n=1 Tax=uncultured Hydrogenophaga sp. TaxID=199683 RepID=UPI00265F76CC|nr:SAM-dependent methyltransferase [uncultured Hydrogenophaga sp.]
MSTETRDHTVKGDLYLVPTPLDFGVDGSLPLSGWLPDATLQVASRLTHWITENAKSTRAFLKRVDAVHPLAAPLQAQQMSELPRAAHKKGDHQPDAVLDRAARELLAPALQGHDIGLVSEAGMPAVADPGSAVVRAAHAMGLTVKPLSGPVSLMLALAASGLNGQQFAFVGYVPQDPTERGQRLRALEGTALRLQQAQLLIETPYRNAALLAALVQTLQPGTRLAVAAGLGLPQQSIRSAPVAEWRQHPQWAATLPLSLPAVFMLGG